MKALFIGANKSGKSHIALDYTLALASKKPYFIATAIPTDEEMQKKIEAHKKDRQNRFITIEEPIELYKVIKPIENYKLIDCLSFWVSNLLLNNKEDEILTEAEKISQIENSIFVINEVGAGVIPANELARKFAHYNGLVSQIIAKNSYEVYFCIAGLSLKLK
jgi:adenosylcobinamide kinase/adenosylcobinamide-phosphate guanylyltransferase